ncbi:uncharacterized protein LOC106154773 [Lingula anatina]|uniref:Uncharacterized protein LOC106154773 n=1 Tax=Lingula anatina TaxID=7574 RepID=A0A1S3HGT9_LINAN|nr:uncharacterized protein LOC106154773 [Lingula anatina]|eukprot:XP_013384706.1 uncharacterized protein LOC106154773 [Lingula anatina]
MLSDTVNFSVSCKGFKVVNIQLPIFTDAIKDEEEVQVFTKYGRLGWQYSGMAYRVNKERKVLNFVLRLPDVGEYAWFRVQRVKNDTEGKGLSPNDGDPINDSLLVKLAPMLGKDWESLAKHIGLSPQIFTNNSDDDTTNACAVLRKWSQSVPISADKASTLQKVFGQIGRQDLAALLKQS